MKEIDSIESGDGATPSVFSAAALETAHLETNVSIDMAPETTSAWAPDVVVESSSKSQSSLPTLPTRPAPPTPPTPGLERSRRFHLSLNADHLRARIANEKESKNYYNNSTNPATPDIEQASSSTSSSTPTASQTDSIPSGIFDRKRKGGAVVTPRGVKGTPGAGTPISVAGSAALATPGREFVTSVHSNSIVHVHIRDLEPQGGVSNTYKQTGAALKRCKSLVMKPYWRLLNFISWRPIGIGTFDPCRLCYFNTFNTLYPVFVASLLIFTYSLEIVACIGNFDLTKLNETNDCGCNSSCGNTSSAIPLAPAAVRCNHIITTYIVADVLHFAAFCLGLYGERVLQSEQLSSLMEKVFLVVSPIAGVPAVKDAQKLLMRRLRIFMYCGLLWAAAAAALRILFSVAYRGGPFKIDIWLYGKNMEISQIVGNDAGAWTLAILQYVGVIYYHCVTVAIISNYAAECELLRSLIHSLASQIQGKSVSLQDAMKELSYIRSSVRAMNGPVSRMASLVTVGNLEMTVLGTVYLFLLSSEAHGSVWIYREVHVAIYALVTILPFYEAARLNATSLKFRSIALDARVFGYPEATQISLDSFLNFVTTLNVKAKLMMVPIKHTVFSAFVVGSSILILLLMQLSVITPRDSYL